MVKYINKLKAKKQKTKVKGEYKIEKGKNENIIARIRKCCTYN